MKNKVLITSCGRKVSLVKAFKNAGWYVIAQDIDKDSVAFKFADESFSYPHTYNIDGDHVILSVAYEKKVDLIVPTRDAEILEFASMNLIESMTPFHILVPNYITSSICIDKLKFYHWCKTNGFKTPEVHFVKPRVSQSGKETECVWQELIEGKEYSIDLFSWEGKVINLVPRKRTKVLNGESCVSQTVEPTPFMEEAIRLSTTLGLVGHNVLQCFLTKDGLVWLEVNPRFGGASAVAIKAGLKSPEWLLKIINREKVESYICQYQVGLVGKSYTEWEFE